MCLGVADAAAAARRRLQLSNSNGNGNKKDKSQNNGKVNGRKFTMNAAAALPTAEYTADDTTGEIDVRSLSFVCFVLCCFRFFPLLSACFSGSLLFELSSLVFRAGRR